MAGHSHWAGIKHKKNRVDKERSKIFAKLSKEITVAAKIGDKNPEMNPRLRSAIQSARSSNMPKDNILRAIEKSKINLDSTFENLRYEGFGPCKIAVIVETLTDNKNRTASKIRTIFQKNGGNLGTQGSASHNFNQIGVIKMKISANEIKIGMLLEYKNDLWEVLKTQHVKPGKGGAFNQVEMKSINKNTKLNERFRSEQTIEKASIEEIKHSFIYEDENNYFFIDQKSFEQINIEKKILGEKGKLLKENLEVNVKIHDNIPIGVDLPNQINCKIESTEAALKGQTVSSSYKPAVLENGISVQVPPFIESGDEIILDTRSLEYIKKV